METLQQLCFTTFIQLYSVLVFYVFWFARLGFSSRCTLGELSAVEHVCVFTPTLGFHEDMADRDEF